MTTTKNTFVSIVLMGTLALFPDPTLGNDKEERNAQVENNERSEQNVSLDFDHYLYLPEDFNPYSGMQVMVDSIKVIEVAEEVALGFDHYLYLPENFNPYSGTIWDMEQMKTDQNEISTDLGFDHYLYLPEGFNPYQGMVFDISDIEVKEYEEME
ncbi:hypothetical protein [Maribacter sp. 2-571]|uniref:hypothetical protein n=1 Tax=Maribacter sp. 2-571 TaxID=3417569 RepID=UPI003D324A02